MGRRPSGVAPTAGRADVPELPEVETVRRDIESVYVGDRLQSVEVSGPRTVRRHPAPLLRQLEGLELTGTARWGKYMMLDWSGGRRLVVHLRMSGQLRYAGEGSELVSHTHAVLRFARTGELRFVDPRTFGELFLPAAPGPAALEGAADAELAHMGPDALEVGAAYLAARFAGRRAPVKALLTDQRLVAGIGNIYADEICFAARVRPDRPGGDVSRAQVGRLAASTLDVLGRAIEARGSTLADRQYCDLFGRPGSFQSQHSVYGRAGAPCTACGRPVGRVSLGARRAYLCARCQR